MAVDERISNRTICHFAKVLVKLDLRKDKEAFIMYERAGHCVIASVGYEKHPEFCSSCKILGHTTSDHKRKSRVQGKATKKQQP